MDTGARGRKTHNFYRKLCFVNKKLENGRTAAQCTVCNVVLKNTAVARLRTHRKRCHPADSSESRSEDEPEESAFGCNEFKKHTTTKIGPSASGILDRSRADDVSDSDWNDQNENQTDDELMMVSMNSLNEVEEENVTEEILFDVDVNEACLSNTESFKIISEEEIESLFSQDRTPTDIHVTDHDDHPYSSTSTSAAPTPLEGIKKHPKRIQTQLTLHDVFSSPSPSSSSASASKPSSRLSLYTPTSSTPDPDLQLQGNTENIERKFPTVAVLAQKLLKVPASSAQLERVFSNWSFVHSSIRNRLTTEKSTKLIFVYYSLKLRDSSKTDQY